MTEAVYTYIHRTMTGCIHIHRADVYIPQTSLPWQSRKGMSASADRTTAPFLALLLPVDTSKTR